MTKHEPWEPNTNLVPELEAYTMDLSSRVLYARLRRDGKLPEMHAERIMIVDEVIGRMMEK